MRISIVLFFVSGIFPDSCNMELAGFLDFGQGTSDITGFVHDDGREFAVVGLIEDAATFVDITDPFNPFEVGRISGTSSKWRDLKYWNHHVYIGTEAQDGIKVVSVDDPSNPVLVHNITDFTSSHNIHIDFTGYLYVVGAAGHDIWIYELTDHPDNPILVGTWDGEYLHDIEVYNNKLYGSAIYSGKFYILDVSDKSNPTTLLSYDTGGGYISTHDCAVTNNEQYLITADETSGGHIKIWDISDYGNINLVSEYMIHPDHSVHNIYIRPETNLVIMSYYVDGTRVLDIADPLNPVEVGYFDTSNLTGLYDGNWGTYAYLSSGHIISSDRQTGLLIFKSPLFDPQLNWSVNDCDSDGNSVQGYNQHDLDVLEDIISANNLSITDPTDFGTQYWKDGRLIDLNLYSGYTTDTTSVQLTTLPDSIGNLSSLKRLILTGNKLTSLPPAICHMATNCFIDVDDNQLCEDDLLCDNIGSIINQDCNLYPDCNYGFTGISEEAYCYNQSDLDVLQTFIDYSGETIDMDMDQNGNGVIEPLEFGNQDWNAGRLTYLDLFHKELTGEITPEIDDLEKLTYLNLGSNELNGVIPQSIGNLKNLTFLHLGDNQLSGDIPHSFGDLSSLESLFLHHNQLSGSIPAMIGNLSSLTVLNLSNNELNGELPKSICALMIDFGDRTDNGSTYFMISNNNLCPPYPDCLVNQEPFTDENENGIWDDEEPYEDTNENGMYEKDYVGEQDITICQSMSINDNIMPTIYNISSPYPNPFNPIATISFFIPKFGYTTITACDITGREVETLINTTLNPGSYTIHWYASSYPSGMYFIKMIADQYIQTQKLMLIK